MEYFSHSPSNSTTSLGLVEYHSEYQLLDIRYRRVVDQVVNRVERVLRAEEINFIWNNFSRIKRALTYMPCLDVTLLLFIYKAIFLQKGIQCLK